MNTAIFTFQILYSDFRLRLPRELFIARFRKEVAPLFIAAALSGYLLLDHGICIGGFYYHIYFLSWSIECVVEFRKVINLETCRQLRILCLVNPVFKVTTEFRIKKNPNLPFGHGLLTRQADDHLLNLIINPLTSLFKTKVTTSKVLRDSYIY